MNTGDLYEVLVEAVVVLFARDPDAEVAVPPAVAEWLHNLLSEPAPTAAEEVSRRYCRQLLAPVVERAKRVRAEFVTELANVRRQIDWGEYHRDADAFWDVRQRLRRIEQLLEEVFRGTG